MCNHLKSTFLILTVFSLFILPGCNDTPQTVDPQCKEGAGRSCTVGLGECMGTGVYECLTDGGLVCNAKKKAEPVAEICGDGLDNDCDGQPDNGCSCEEGASQPCYTGPSGTKGVGVCKEGTQKCVNKVWGACEGAVLPSDEICDGLDNDCDGVIDGPFIKDMGANCVAGKGSCMRVGKNICSADKKSVVCDAVAGQPETETCDGLDNNCDGRIDDGCSCTDGEKRECFPGPLSAKGNGECKAGQMQCQGSSFGECAGYVLPAAEICDGLDNDCDGVIDNGFNLGGSCTVAKGGGCTDVGVYVCTDNKLGTTCKILKTVCDEKCIGKYLCPQAGDNKCSVNSVNICSQDADGCLVWTKSKDCAQNEVCSSGRCESGVAKDTSCDSCPLKLVLISKTSDAGLINKVVLAVEYAPTGSDPKPRMADIRLSSNLVVALDSADKGQALTDSGKDLYIDPLTNKSWKKRADGSYQFLIHSLSNANYISTGRLFTLTLSMNLKGPLYFRLTKREQTFAPADADSLLQGTPYDGSVVVLP